MTEQGKALLRVHGQITSLSLEEAVRVLNEFRHRAEQSWQLNDDEHPSYVMSDVQYESLTIFEALAIAETYDRLRRTCGLISDEAASIQFSNHPFPKLSYHSCNRAQVSGE